MRYDMIISDFDGTLVRSDDVISPRAVAAIKAFTEAGGVFGISTGRAFSSIRQRLGEPGLCGGLPVMCCQGALACDSESGAIISEIPMDKRAAVEFLATAESLGLTCQFYTADKVYASELNEINDFYFRKNRIEPEVVGKVSEFAANGDFKILKTLFFTEPTRRAEMLEKFGKVKGLKVFASHPYLIEAVSENAGKGNGLISTCRRLNKDITRTVAIGDELNDVEMLKAAGLGVAMGNAVVEAKVAADYVTDECDDDGVAKVIEKILSNEL